MELVVSPSTVTVAMTALLFSCWMKNEAIYYAVLLPIGIVIIANTIAFAMVIHALICARRRMKAHQNNVSERKTALLHLKAGVAVFVVLGKYLPVLTLNLFTVRDKSQMGKLKSMLFAL